MAGWPQEGPGRFWKGNLHTHSTDSDGNVSPPAACARYRAAGYDFLALTEHLMDGYVACVGDPSRLSSPGFLVVPSAEMHAGTTRLGEPWHLGGIGLPVGFPLVIDESAEELVARAGATGAFVIANHPAWYGVTAAEIRGLAGVHAVEVFNATTLDLNDRADSWVVLDELIASGGRHLAVATDDAHFTDERDDVGRAWVMVWADDLSVTALVDSLKAGRYYSSTGPEIHALTLDSDDTLVVRHSPAARVFVIGPGSPALMSVGHGRSESKFDLGAIPADVVRVTVRDAQGGRAWTNPMWLRERDGTAIIPPIW